MERYVSKLQCIRQIISYTFGWQCQLDKYITFLLGKPENLRNCRINNLQKIGFERNHIE